MNNKKREPIKKDGIYIEGESFVVENSELLKINIEHLMKNMRDNVQKTLEEDGELIV